MDTPDDQKLFEMLLDEIENTLSDFEQRCLNLEKGESSSELNIIFRAAHNIKGASHLYGLPEFAGVVHFVEDLLNILRHRQKPIEAASVDILLRSHSFLSEWVSAMRQDRTHVPDSSALRTTIEEHIAHLKQFDSEKTAETTSEPPPASVSLQAESKSPASIVTSVAGPEPAGRTIHVQSRQRKNTEDRKKRRSSGNLRIPSVKIDEIMQLIGELSIQQSILWHGNLTNTLNSPICKNAVTLNEKALKDLHNLILTLRMQPVESMFQRVERVARDLSRELNKKVQVSLQGSDVLLDKTVIELMVDPMVHLVRNAMDHGLEEDEVRIQLGKPTPSRLQIRAVQDAGQVIISISDDGKGMDPQVIRNKAIEKGLISANQKLNDDECVQLIFVPGFSTRDQVTELSGRGVGMDVVQQAIQQMGGRIETASKKGQGTTFHISLPTSLEIIDALVIRVQQCLYIAPMQDVVEIADLNAFTLEKLGQGGHAIKLREHLVPIDDMAEYISTKQEDKNAAPRNSRQNIALIIRLPDRSRLGLRVDEIVSQQQIVVRPLNDQLAHMPGFSGMTILGNGEPGMILDLPFIGECYLKWVSRTRSAA